jgi:hypothetical protein
MATSVRVPAPPMATRAMTHTLLMATSIMTNTTALATTSAVTVTHVVTSLGLATRDFGGSNIARDGRAGQALP